MTFPTAVKIIVGASAILLAIYVVYLVQRFSKYLHLEVVKVRKPNWMIGLVLAFLLYDIIQMLWVVLDDSLPCAFQHYNGLLFIHCLCGLYEIKLMVTYFQFRITAEKARLTEEWFSKHMYLTDDVSLILIFLVFYVVPGALLSTILTVIDPTAGVQSYGQLCEVDILSSLFIAILLVVNGLIFLSFAYFFKNRIEHFGLITESKYTGGVTVVFVFIWITIKMIPETLDVTYNIFPITAYIVVIVSIIVLYFGMYYPVSYALSQRGLYKVSEEEFPLARQKSSERNEEEIYPDVEDCLVNPNYSNSLQLWLEEEFCVESIYFLYAILSLRREFVNYLPKEEYDAFVEKKKMAVPGFRVRTSSMHDNWNKRFVKPSYESNIDIELTKGKNHVLVKTIYDNYINRNSFLAINISDEVYHDITSGIKEVEDLDDSSLYPCEVLRRKIFDTAYTNLLNMLEYGAYSRWVVDDSTQALFKKEVNKS